LTIDEQRKNVCYLSKVKLGQIFLSSHPLRTAKFFFQLTEIAAEMARLHDIERLCLGERIADGSKKQLTILSIDGSTLDGTLYSSSSIPCTTTVVPISFLSICIVSKNVKQKTTHDLCRHNTLSVQSFISDTNQFIGA
jgi:hypothetical protein